MSARLNAAGLEKIHHIAAMPLEMVQLLLGNQAEGMRRFAHGIDERPLVPAREPAKSFGQQETFSGDLTDAEYIEAILRRMADNLFAKVRQEIVEQRTHHQVTGEPMKFLSLSDWTGIVETELFAKTYKKSLETNKDC
jgi:DNA polymerase-4